MGAVCGLLFSGFMALIAEMLMANNYRNGHSSQLPCALWVIAFFSGFFPLLQMLFGK